MERLRVQGVLRNEAARAACFNSGRSGKPAAKGLMNRGFKSTVYGFGLQLRVQDQGFEVFAVKGALKGSYTLNP